MKVTIFLFVFALAIGVALAGGYHGGYGGGYRGYGGGHKGGYHMGPWWIWRKVSRLRTQIRRIRWWQASWMKRLLQALEEFESLVM
ncbi:hypothetical protein MRX96_029829 [Rhipicephalus microplus]